MRDIFITRQFKTDRKSIIQKQDVAALKLVLDYLIDGTPLPPEYREHPLQGNYAYCLECHARPNLLLIYRLDGNKLTLYRVGSHSKLLKK